MNSAAARRDPSKVSMPARPLPSFLREHADGATIAIRVQPRASRTEIGECTGTELRIKISAPPVDSAANEALVRLLAEILECPRRDVQLIRGHTSRSKVVKIRGLPATLIVARLAHATGL
jgi:uncharacterized protein (TIGR00251 family)